ncbi:hypothetical protein FKM82_023739 [Ascaphus truei]
MRLCQRCELGEVEDETHFLLRCTQYSEVRSAHLEKLTAVIQNFNNTEENQKIAILLGEDETTAELAAHYISTCHKLRDVH